MFIFLVHHNRKERDSNNVFNDITGSTGIMGVADTCMVLRKENRFGTDAVLSITGRDIEEKRLKLAMQKNVWEVTEALDATSLRKEQAPHYLFDIADYLLKEKGFEGTANRKEERMLDCWFSGLMTTVTVMTVKRGARSFCHYVISMTPHPRSPQHRHNRHLRHGRILQIRTRGYPSNDALKKMAMAFS